MRVLVLGQGGREHAIVRALYFSASVSEVHVAPGNLGMSEAIHHDISLDDFAAIIALCHKFTFDLIIVGPEQPLVDGLTDELRKLGIAVFGPSKEAAQLEGSKIFCKEFLIEAGVPTAYSEVVSSVEETMTAVAHFKPPYVLKADGLAAGKGVFICGSLEELRASAEEIFDKKTLGIAGERALLEAHQKGYELSYFILTNGDSFTVLPLAQDHKRIGEGETGPNTGGMGTIAPITISSKEQQQILEQVIQPTIDNFKKRQFIYRGVLFIGLMMTDEGPSVLEFNTRFGDPETQVLLPLLDGDWGEVFLQVAKGKLSPLKWKSLYAACVVLAAEGYPQNPKKGVVIEGDPAYQTSSSYFLHAGTSQSADGRWLVNGGRVLNAVGLGADLKESVKKSYEIAEKVQWPKMQMRRDIGKKYL